MIDSKLFSMSFEKIKSLEKPRIICGKSNLLKV